MRAFCWLAYAGRLVVGCTGLVGRHRKREAGKIQNHTSLYYIDMYQFDWNIYIKPKRQNLKYGRRSSLMRMDGWVGNVTNDFEQ